MVISYIVHLLVVNIASKHELRLRAAAFLLHTSVLRHIPIRNRCQNTFEANRCRPIDHIRHTGHICQRARLFLWLHTHATNKRWPLPCVATETSIRIDLHRLSVRCHSGQLDVRQTETILRHHSRHRHIVAPKIPMSTESP